jgi:phosphate transport system substrate-binding protein
MKRLCFTKQIVHGTRTVSALGCSLLLFATSCSEKQQTSPAPPSLQGKIVIKGSNTIGEELGPRLIAEYKKQHPAALVELESKLTGYGLAALIAGQCNIASASRAPLPDELEQARARNVELDDHVIGAYSVAVIVNAANPIADLNRNQIRDIFMGAVQNWKDVGGPDAPVALHIRDPISGTYHGFRELAMENKYYSTNRNTFTNYAGIVEAVAKDANGIGYCSIELATKPGIKAVSVGGVAPTIASVNESKYPYARVLHFYTSKGKEEPSAKEFIDFVQSAKGQEIVAQTGNVPKK